MLLGWEPGQRNGLDILRSLMGDRAGEPRKPGGRQGQKRAEGTAPAALKLKRREQTAGGGRCACGRGPRAGGQEARSAHGTWERRQGERPSGRLLKGAKEGTCCRRKACRAR